MTLLDGQRPTHAIDLALLWWFENLSPTWSEFKFSELDEAKEKAFSRLVFAGEIEERREVVVRFDGSDRQFSLRYRSIGLLDEDRRNRFIVAQAQPYLRSLNLPSGLLGMYPAHDDQFEARLTSDGIDQQELFRNGDLSLFTAIGSLSTPTVLSENYIRGVPILESCEVLGGQTPAGKQEGAVRDTGKAADNGPNLSTEAARDLGANGGGDYSCSFLSVRELAKKHDVSAPALRSRLDRWRKDNRGAPGWTERDVLAANEAKYLYSEDAVSGVINALKARAATKQTRNARASEKK